MIVEAKDRALPRIVRVGTDAFEDTDSVVKGVSEDADLGFIARNEFSIEPDFFHKEPALRQGRHSIGYSEETLGMASQSHHRLPRVCAEKLPAFVTLPLIHPRELTFLRMW